MLADSSLYLRFFLILLAGFGAGFINAIVGSGTLISFPVLLLLGFPPLTANISSAVGLVAGNIAGAFGYRQEIKQNLPLIKMLVPSSILGGATGASLLLVLPASAFDFVVPSLVALGLLMVAFGPLIQKRVAARSTTTKPVLSSQQAEIGALPRGGKRIAIIIIVFLLGIYGGYFGAAQGVLMVGILGAMLTISLQSLNAAKNFLVSFVNILASIIFICCSGELINWFVVLAVALGASVGGLVGAKVGRRLSPALLRGVILVVGTGALINLLV
ncbi:sulfite exporter TauE/SafE family protein [uncultured Rothia sp.]|uniref:sulfite exporter TauE/SafE family protein n=1 Tax=uncultured Rothia sp. TaxID=316088 RepID=UPI003217B759